MSKNVVKTRIASSKFGFKKRKDCQPDAAEEKRAIKSVLEGPLLQARSKRGLLLPELTYQINFQIQDMDKKAELIKPRGFEQGENVRFFISAERTSQHFDHSAHLSES